MLTVGAVVSTSAPLVFGGVKTSPALLPTASLIVPPFKSIGEADATRLPTERWLLRALLAE